MFLSSYGLVHLGNFLDATVPADSGECVESLFARFLDEAFRDVDLLTMM